MKPDQEMAGLIRDEMEYYAHPRLRDRLWENILMARKSLAPGAIPIARRGRLRDRFVGAQVARLAAAAVLLVGTGLLIHHFVTRPAQPSPTTVARDGSHPVEPAGLKPVLEQEMEMAGQLFARQDLAGLVKLMETGQDATKARIADYLGQIGDRSAMSALQSLAAQWQGPSGDNPFSRAIAAIEARLSPAPPASAVAAESPTPAVQVAALQPPQPSPTGVSGRVVDKVTQKPVQGATVQYMLDNPATATRTDDVGRFTLTGLQPGTHTFIHIMARGYASQRIIPRVVKDQVTPDVLVELDPGCRVQGTVTDPQGRPIAGATARTFFFTNLPVVTGPDGRFEIDGVNPVADSHSLQVTHPDYPAVSTNFEPGAAGEIVYLDIVLSPGTDVFGRVTGPDGKPVEGVQVGNTRSGAMWNCIRARTDSEGMYRLDNVELGELILWASHPRYALHVERATLEAGTAQTRMDIRLEAPTPLHGRVLDDVNEPVAGVTVVVHEYDGVSNLANERYTTDANGVFVIANAPAAGPITLNPFGGGISGELQKFELGQAQYILKVHRAGRIYGKVVMDTTGEPIPEFLVKMTFSSRGGLSSSYSATWNREGYGFRSPEGLFDTGEEDLPTGGRYKMTVTAPGFDPLTLDPVVVQPTTDDPNRTEFRLKPATMLAGVIVDGRGNPVKDAVVAVFSKAQRFDPLHWRQFATDAAGVFVVTGIGNEDEFFYITAPGFDPQYVYRSELDTQTGEPVRIAMAGGRLFGTVVDEQGRPRANAVIRIGRDRDIDDVPFISSLTREVQGDAEGRYELSDLPSGHFWIDVRFKSEAGYGDDWTTRKIRLTPGQSLEVNFGNEPGFVLSGVVRRGPTPEKGATVKVTTSEGVSKFVNTDEAGAFRVTGVAPGQVRVQIACHETDSENRTWTRVKEDRTVQVQSDTRLDVDLAESR